MNGCHYISCSWKCHYTTSCTLATPSALTEADFQCQRFNLILHPVDTPGTTIQRNNRISITINNCILHIFLKQIKIFLVLGFHDQYPTSNFSIYTVNLSQNFYVYVDSTKLKHIHTYSPQYHASHQQSILHHHNLNFRHILGVHYLATSVTQLNPYHKVITTHYCSPLL